MADEVTLSESPAGAESTLVELDAGRLGEPPAAEPSEPPVAGSGSDESPVVKSADPESPAEETSAPAGRRRVRWRRTFAVVGWVILVAALVVAVLAAVDLATGRHSALSLRSTPGDCLAGESDSDLKRVPCDGPDARWAVVGVVENKTEREAGEGACAAWPNAEASYWESRNGTSGFVLCLGPVLTT